MKKLHIIFFWYIFAVGSFARLSAQNQYHISLFGIHQPFGNVAAIGSYEYINGAFFHKSQWVGVKNAPNFQGFDFSLPLPKNNSLGVSLLRDQINVHQQYDLALNYAYNLRLKKDYFMSFGLAPVIVFRQSLFNRLSLQNPEDPLFQNTRLLVMPNLRLGLYFYGPRFYVSLSTNRFLHNTLSKENKALTNFNGKEIHLQLSGGYEFALHKNLDLDISTILRYVYGAPLSADFRVQFLIYKFVGLGIAYRTNNDLYGSILVEVYKNIKLAYAFGWNFGAIRRASKGDHEVMLLWAIPKEKKTKVVIPRF